MRTFGLFIIISMLTRNPLLALVIILMLFLLLDRRFIGILPDFTAPLRRGKYLSELQREVAVNPQNAEVHLELGEMYFQNRKYERALEHLNQALVKMDDSALGRYYRGASMYHLGKKEQSISELEQAVEINPKIAHGYPYLYLLRHNYAEELLDKLRRYGSVQAMFDTGKYLKSIGKNKEAVGFFNEVLDIYRMSSPTMRRKYRRMAIYARLQSK